MNTDSSMATSRDLILVDNRLGFRLSWGAVFAGLLIATTVQVVLTMAGSAIGLAAFDPDSGKGLGIGAAAWALISILVSLFVGGAVTGQLVARYSAKAGTLHGIMLWSLSTLLTIWMVSSGVGAVTGAAFGAVTSVVGTTASAVGQGAMAAGAAGVAKQQADGGDLDIRSEIEKLLRQTGEPSLQPDSLRQDARDAKNVVTRGPQDNGAAADEVFNMLRNRVGNVDRDAVVNVIMERTGKSRAEAEQLADRAVQLRETAARKLDSLQKKAGEVAESVASATAAGLWLALLALGLSLVAAVVGTRSGGDEMAAGNRESVRR